MPVTAAQNQKQRLVLEPGATGTFRITFTISHDGWEFSEESPPIDASMSAAAVQRILETMLPLGAGNIEVTGSPGDWILEYKGRLS